MSVLRKFFLGALLLKGFNSFCQTTSYYPVSIVVGQDTGCGIEHNISTQQCGAPVNPSIGGNDSCTIDLDADGKVDLTSFSSGSYGSQSGGGYFELELYARDSCFICVQPINHVFADSIKLNDVIDSSRTWGKSCNLQNSWWSASGSSYYSGYRPNYYGVKIKNGNIISYGWVSSDFINYSITSLCLINGIKSNVFANEIKTYPNPANDKLIIETNTPSSQLIELIDISGRVVLVDKIVSTSSIDIKNLSAGAYTIVIKNSDNELRRKLIISH